MSYKSPLYRESSWNPGKQGAKMLKRLIACLPISPAFSERHNTTTTMPRPGGRGANQLVLPSDRHKQRTNFGWAYVHSVCREPSCRGGWRFLIKYFCTWLNWRIGIGCDSTGSRCSWLMMIGFSEGILPRDMRITFQLYTIFWIAKLRITWTN